VAEEMIEEAVTEPEPEVESESGIDSGIVELYPWLGGAGIEEVQCEDCEGLVYILDDVWYDADKSLHEDKCRASDETTEPKDDGFGDLDLSLDEEEDEGEPEAAADAGDANDAPIDGDETVTKETVTNKVDDDDFNFIDGLEI